MGVYGCVLHIIYNTAQVAWDSYDTMTEGSSCILCIASQDVLGVVSCLGFFGQRGQAVYCIPSLDVLRVVCVARDF